MSYFPVTPDRSGEILGAGQMQAANTTAQMYSNLGENIGGAIASIGKTYGDHETLKAKGRASKKLFEFLAPTLGMSMDQLQGLYGKDLKSDTDWGHFGDQMGSILPSWINLKLTQDRSNVTQQQPWNNVAARAHGTVKAGGGQVSSFPSMVNPNVIP
jgi:hypothetical protein